SYIHVSESPPTALEERYRDLPTHVVARRAREADLDPRIAAGRFERRDALGRTEPPGRAHAERTRATASPFNDQPERAGVGAGPDDSQPFVLFARFDRPGIRVDVGSLFIREDDLRRRARRVDVHRNALDVADHRDLMSCGRAVDRDAADSGVERKG